MRTRESKSETASSIVSVDEKKTKVRVPRPNWVDISTEYQTHHSLWGMQTVFFSSSPLLSPFLARRTVLKRHPTTTRSDIRALPIDVALRRWSLCTSMSNWAKPIDRELNQTTNDRSECRDDGRVLPEQNKSVADRDPPLPLLLVPEHIDEKDVESRGGSDRRPSTRRRQEGHRWMRRRFLVFSIGLPRLAEERW